MAIFIIRSRDSSSVVTFEDILPQEQMRQHDADGKKIGALVGDLKVRLLGTHVIGLARNHFAFLSVRKPAALATPKSVSFTSPSNAIMMFLKLTSR